MYAIAGVTGHVGSVVAKEILSRGKGVRAIVRTEAKGAPWRALGAEIAVGDLGDTTFLTGALTGTEGAFLLIPPDLKTDDVYGSQRQLVDAMVPAVTASKVPHVVLLSSTGAELPDKTGPVRGLHDLEIALARSGAKVTALRCAFFMDNMQLFLAAAGMGMYPNFFSETVGMTMVATRDVGTFAAQALLEPAPASEVVDVLGPQLKPQEVADAFSKALNKPVRSMPVPPFAWAMTMKQGGLSDHQAAVYSELYRAFNDGLMRPIGGRRLVGTTSLETVIRSFSS